ncbi:MAG TPA: formate/nitrite transporter family protein [Acidimicrobiales bacterium]|nr:formate/nitrite transporter family protein [Acidimicrobiales bacterium]
MPIPAPEAVDDHGALAATKARQVRDLPRYLFLSALAGAYVGVAVVLMVSVSAPLVEAGSGFAKVTQGAVFGVALTLVVFAGSELFTGNAMFMLQGWWQRTVTPLDLTLVWLASLVGNIGGSVAFAAIVHGGGTLAGPGAGLVGSITAAKDAASGTQLFWRAVLCNALVCLALWMAARTRSDGAKLAVLWWGLLAFIGSGFEHSVANATVFSLGALEGSIGWAALARNLAWTVPGNIVGGGLVIGVGYAWVAHRRALRSALRSGHLQGAEVAAPGNGADGGAQRAELGPQAADRGLGGVAVDAVADQG